MKIIEDVPRDEGSILVCLEGKAEEMPHQPSVQGRCVECKREIAFSALAPSWIKKVCRGCALAMMKSLEEEKEEVQIAVTEDSYQEVLENLGLQDTADQREKVERSDLVDWMKGEAEK